MTNKTTSARISLEEEKFLAENFKTAATGLGQASNIIYQANKNGTSPDKIVENLSSLNQIRLYSQREIKGIFSENEWKYLADSLNGTIITDNFRCVKAGLIAGVEDSDSFDNLSEKWDVNIKDFCDKIQKLTAAQIDAVYTRVEQFWNSENRDLDGWAKC